MNRLIFITLNLHHTHLQHLEKAIADGPDKVLHWQMEKR